jgi:hypothetical protein
MGEVIINIVIPPLPQLVNMATGAFLSMVVWTENKADHTPPSSDEVRNDWNFLHKTYSLHIDLNVLLLAFLSPSVCYVHYMYTLTC